MLHGVACPSPVCDLELVSHRCLPPPVPFVHGLQVACGVPRPTLAQWLTLLNVDGWRDDSFGPGAIVVPGRVRLTGLPKLPGVEGLFRGWVVGYKPRVGGGRFTAGTVRVELDVTGRARVAWRY
jgi:hypothetical protein